MAFDTALNVISDAAVELGLSTGVVDPFGSTDANIVQLRTLLKTVGREIERERRWTHLQREHTFTTSANVSVYALPTDFRAMINQSGWNRSSRFPLGGPLLPEEWQMMKSSQMTSAFTVFLRFQQGRIYLFPDTNTPGSLDLAFEYLTSYWVQSFGQSAPDKDAPTANTDTICFDPLLMVRGLKLAWKKEKGLDTTTAQDDYDRALMMVKSDDAASPVLDIGGGGGLKERFIDERNLPDTGYGS